MSEKIYRLEVDDNHLRLIIDALDFYSRIGCGQFSEIEHIWRKFCWDVLPGDAKQKQQSLQLFAERMRWAAESLGEESRQPIASKKIDGRFGEMYDIQKTLQKAVATANGYEEFSVWHYGNDVRYGKNRLVDVTLPGDLQGKEEDPPQAETIGADHE